jgi:uncharacterized alkaline shock family protein YloU
MGTIHVGGAGERPAKDIDEDVLETVAARAALEVDGVVSVDAGFPGGIVDVLGKGNYAGGVRAFAEGGGVGFQINVITRYGARIPEVAWNLQESVKQAVERSVGVTVNKVNVLVAGVRGAGA